MLAPLPFRADVLMFLLGCYAEASLFLLAGNLLCTVGNALWVHLLGTWGPENETYQLLFALFTVANAYATKQAYVRWKALPPEPDTDDEEESDDEDRAAARAAIEAAGGKEKLLKDLKRQAAEAGGVRKHKKAYKPPPKPHQPRRRALNKNA